MFKHLVSRQIKVLDSYLEELIRMLVSVGLMLTIIHICMPELESKLYISISWYAFTIASLNMLESQYRSDHESGLFSMLLLKGKGVTSALCTILCINALLIYIPVLLTISLLWLALSFTFVQALSLLLASVFACIMISVLSFIINALISNLSSSKHLGLLIFLPLYVPVLIFTISSFIWVYENMIPVGQIAFLASISIVAFMLSVFSFEYILKAGVVTE